MNQMAIAEKLGVSQTAISLVLNNPDTTKVSRHKKDKIIKLLKEINYRGFQAGHHGLKTIVYITCHALRSDELTFYLEYQNGIIEQATKYDIDIIVKNFNPDISYNYLTKSNSTGFILNGHFTDFQIKQFSGKCPTVLLNSFSATPVCDSSNPDNRESIRIAIDHLKSKGHKQICFWNMLSKGKTIDFNPHMNERYWAYKEFMADSEQHIELYEVNKSSFEEIEEYAYESLVGNLSKDIPVTAYLTAGYVYALGIINAAKRLKLKIPEDIAVITIDNVPALERTCPTLTSIQQNRLEMGRTAVELVLQRCKEPANSLRRVNSLPKLIPRKST